MKYCECIRNGCWNRSWFVTNKTSGQSHGWWTAETDVKPLISFFLYLLLFHFLLILHKIFLVVAIESCFILVTTVVCDIIWNHNWLIITISVYSVIKENVSKFRGNDLKKKWYNVWNRIPRVKRQVETTGGEIFFPKLKSLKKKSKNKK